VQVRSQRQVQAPCLASEAVLPEHGTLKVCHGLHIIDAHMLVWRVQGRPVCS
jgi:hypothetical protein